MGDQEDLESSFTTDKVMGMLTSLQAMMSKVSEKLLAQEDQIVDIRNRQSILDYEGTPFTPDRKKSGVEDNRRKTLADRDLSKILEPNVDTRILHTPQQFHMKQKFGDFLKFTEYLELVQ